MNPRTAIIGILLVANLVLAAAIVFQGVATTAEETVGHGQSADSGRLEVPTLERFNEPPGEGDCHYRLRVASPADGEALAQGLRGLGLRAVAGVHPDPGPVWYELRLPAATAQAAAREAERLGPLGERLGGEGRWPLVTAAAGGGLRLARSRDAAALRETRRQWAAQGVSTEWAVRRPPARGLVRVYPAPGGYGALPWSGARLDCPAGAD